MKHRNSKNIIPRMSYESNKLVSDIIDVKNDGTNLILTIPLELIDHLSGFELNKRLTLATCPLFGNKIKGSNQYQLTNKLKPPPFPHIAFFTENKTHYTGGRYSLYHQAVLLSQFTKVTVVTNDKPPFYNDFEDYYNDKFNLIIDQRYMIDRNNNEFDLVVGVPMVSGLFANEYTKKHNLPLFSMIFESPNWISKYRAGVDSDEEYWKSYKKVLQKSDKILVPSKESKKYLIEWIGKANVSVIYPCMNTIVADKIEIYDRPNSRKNILFTSRMSDFKNPLLLVKKFGKEYDFHFIGKVWEMSKRAIGNLNDKGYHIVIHEKCSDYKKFQLIESCDLLIHPSKFEGFGMSPMEGIYFDKPVLVYDLPVLKEIYGNSIAYAEYDNADKFVKKAKDIMSNGFIKNEKHKVKVLKFSSIKNCISTLLDVFNIPKISAGMIIYNGEDYVRESINSIKDKLYELIIVEGAVKNYAKSPVSIDKTILYISDIIKNEKFRNIKLVQGVGFWKDKIAMQNVIAQKVTGNFYLKLDHDEIWKQKTVDKIMKMFYDDNNLMIIKMPFVHFWLSFDKAAKDAGGKWGAKHPRIWRWRKGYFHQNNFNFFNDKENDYRKVTDPFYKSAVFEGELDDVVFHFGYVRKLNILTNKINYYKNRKIENFVIDTVTDYKPGKMTQPTQQVSSWAEDFDKKLLPKIMDNHKYYNSQDIRSEKL